MFPQAINANEISILVRLFVRLCNRRANCVRFCLLCACIFVVVYVWVEWCQAGNSKDLLMEEVVACWRAMGLLTENFTLDVRR
jgi:Ca2+/H+ antiporter